MSLINDDSKKILANFLDEYQKLKIINKRKEECLPEINQFCF